MHGARCPYGHLAPTGLAREGREPYTVAHDLIARPAPTFADRALVLQLPLQSLDFLRKAAVVADESFYLAHRMQDGRVVPIIKFVPDVGIRAQRQFLG